MVAYGLYKVVKLATVNIPSSLINHPAPRSVSSEGNVPVLGLQTYECIDTRLNNQRMVFPTDNPRIPQVTGPA